MNKEIFRKEINDLKARGLFRQLREQSAAQDREIEINGRKVLNFCSNNYLGLANDERLSAALICELKKSGIGSGASRLISGNMSAHETLERKIAALKGTEACLVFNSGYMANVGIISAICGRGDIVLSDKSNHASIVDGIILSRAEFKRYPHCDFQALEDILKGCGNYRRRMIVTDTVFSMDGDIAPLDRLTELAEKFDCLLMTDEAHGFGVIGKNGAGAAEYFNVSDRIDIQMGTLSKAAGCIGAYVCGTKDLIEVLVNKARSFIYTTAMPPGMAAAACAAVDIIRSDRDRRKKLADNSEFMRDGLKKTGFDTMNSATSIIPVLIGGNDKAVELARRLLEKDIFTVAIRPPTVPEGSARLRFTVMATHTKDDIRKAVYEISKIGKEMGII
jgi:glycine C-acetyltransferase